VKLVGMLIAYSVAIPLGMLYTRVIERNKANAWNFDSYMTLSDIAFEDINWWKLNLKA
jgi:hypothetical protein